LSIAVDILFFVLTPKKKMKKLEKLVVRPDLAKLRLENCKKMGTIA